MTIRFEEHISLGPATTSDEVTSNGVTSTASFTPTARSDDVSSSTAPLPVRAFSEFALLASVADVKEALNFDPAAFHALFKL